MQGTPATGSSCTVGVSAPGVDTAVICSKITEGSAAWCPGNKGVSAPGADTNTAARRRGVKSASTPGVDDTASSVGGCKRATREKLACSCAAGLNEKAKCNQAGLDCVRPRKESTDGYDKGNPFQGWAWTRNKWSRAPQEETTAQATQAAQVSVWDREATRDVCRGDIGHDVEWQDVERLDTGPYWSPVPVNAIGESSDECVGADVASSHELGALCEGPVR
ncbi:hypothetical protein PC119_g27524 [Phytophthora cactorum]|uniref:Uncharacterized protein n=1 Tax=Phytophthora cactorum TaxID=29920 RepID=A0A8T1ABC3_9STRA|nr:hypothetical protein PC117_g27597 [Phytophthora cactorum]KAG2956883.1 hypothetical protein PC119_g27524 [Phytophthora cactorum]